ncbi:formimidoylglutamate deiminase [Luteimonas sp. A277]
MDNPVTRAATGWRLPAIPNLHSHAFQRAMAGMAERRTDPADSFWTWRETMYRFAGRMTPDTMRAVAAQLYVEMLEAGYGSVCEFQYVHHQPDGRPYADAAEMSLALVEAAREAGIRMTLLPVLYMTGGFDGRPLTERQARFGHDVDAYLSLLDRLQELEGAQLKVGACFHSLRAVPEEAMRRTLAALPPDMPVHIHIAEQTAEVEDSVALRGARPVEWLCDHFDVDARWALVHATHLTPDETRRIAASGATVVLCPTTEANLGDGLFPLRAYLDAGGRWGIGSDSHISVSPVEELRWLEYGQRLVARRRNIAVGHSESVGENLLHGALEGAAHVTGFGPLDDWIELDAQAPELVGATASDVADRWVFSGNRPLVETVCIGGTTLVSGGRHRDRDATAARYRGAIGELS